MTIEIKTPADESLEILCGRLSELAQNTATQGSWPAQQLRLCGEAGVFRWFLPKIYGGFEWSEADITRGYLALSKACLSTTFTITQRVGACRRIAACGNEPLKEELLPTLLTPETFATVGISHLTTSRRHLKKPPVLARATEEGYLINGTIPWVTGAENAETVVVGTVLETEEGPTNDEILFALPTKLAGVSTPEPFEMVGLTASRTGPVVLEDVLVSKDRIVDGPLPEVIKHGKAGRPGGPQTSTLATGAASASIAILADEASRRPDLVAVHDALAEEHEQIVDSLLAAAEGSPTCEASELRRQANSHVLRASQAALTATKGAGYLATASAGRYCKESLFFLVWSCPQVVQNANLCELAGLEV